MNDDAIYFISSILHKIKHQPVLGKPDTNTIELNKKSKLWIKHFTTQKTRSRPASYVKDPMSNLGTR